MKLRHLHLFSKDPQELAQFLADVFDYIIIPSEKNGAIVVEGEDWSFFIRPALAGHLFSASGERDVEFEFILESLNELEELSHKIEFHFYRSKGMSPQDHIIWERTNKESSFFLTDPEGRKWRFSSEVDEQ